MKITKEEETASSRILENQNLCFEIRNRILIILQTKAKLIYPTIESFKIDLTILN